MRLTSVQMDHYDCLSDVIIVTAAEKDWDGCAVWLSMNMQVSVAL